MYGYVITGKGAEGITATEIPELIDCNDIRTDDTVVIFKIMDLLDLCTVCYKSQSIYRGVLLLAEFPVHESLGATVSGFNKKIEAFKDWIQPNKSFNVECQREGDHDFRSIDVAPALGKRIVQYAKSKNIDVKPDYTSPDINFYTYINGDKGYFGVDFSGIELAKRQYKIFNHPQSLKATTAYALVKESEYELGKKMLDPFMGSGVIVIEAALHALNFPVHYYDKDDLLFTRMDFFKQEYENFFKAYNDHIIKKDTEIYGFDAQLRFLKATQKNAKLAGIQEYINLTKTDVEWLDIKFDENKVDCIVTDPPRYSKNRNEKELLKIYKEFFYQAEYILKPEGNIVVLAKDYTLLEEAAKKHKFKIDKKYMIYQGHEKFYIIKFRGE